MHNNLFVKHSKNYHKTSFYSLHNILHKNASSFILSLIIFSIFLSNSFWQWIVQSVIFNKKIRTMYFYYIIQQKSNNNISMQIKAMYNVFTVWPSFPRNEMHWLSNVLLFPLSWLISQHSFSCNVDILKRWIRLNDRFEGVCFMFHVSFRTHSLKLAIQKGKYNLLKVS